MIDGRIKRRRKKVPQWIKDAVAYWQTRVYEGDIGCDWDEADVRCWRCGYLRKCQKCHIVAKSLGGSDEVDNLIPLCCECHDEMPNVLDKEEVWRWIERDHGSLHDTFWACKAMADSGLSHEDFKRFDSKVFEDAMKKTSKHFGQKSGGARTSVATLVWALKEACSDD